MLTAFHVCFNDFILQVHFFNFLSQISKKKSLVQKWATQKDHSEDGILIFNGFPHKRHAL